MEAQCSAPPPAQLGESVVTAKDAVASVEPMFFEDSTFGQTNGATLDEDMPYDPADFHPESSSSAGLDAQDSVDSQVSEVVSLPCQTDGNEEFSTQTEVNESVDLEESKTVPSEIPKTNLVPSGHNPTVQVEIETLKEDSTGEEQAPLTSVTLESKGDNREGIDMELHETLESSGSNPELAQLAKMTDEAQTHDLLAEFSDALHAQETTAPVDNNNFDKQEEVLNRKELLDILEGNEPENENHNVPEAEKIKKVQEGVNERCEGNSKKLNQEITCPPCDLQTPDALEQYDVPEAIEETLVMSQSDVHMDPKEETLVAMRQLSSLPRTYRGTARSSTSSKAHSRSKKSIKKESKDVKKRRGRSSNVTKSPTTSPTSTDQLSSEETKDTLPNNQTPSETNGNRIRKKSQEPTIKSKDLIKVLVEDWDDEEPTAEPTQEQPSPKPIDGNSTEEPHIPEHTEEPLDVNKDHASSEDTPTQSALPQRRASRVIKKKVIFDPDNPDTFTSKKSTNITKAKSPHSDSEHKEHTPSKKIKSEVCLQRSKEKVWAVANKTESSPAQKPKEKSAAIANKTEINTRCELVSKSPGTKVKNATQWKKPPPKNNKQNKRLSEVDKLLMDEGAVNMMYQLNSADAEVPKTKRNIRTKAAFIKKINQNTTPNFNEIKFRERRKETNKSEEVQERSGRDGRLRSSLSNSVASPSVCEDYENHSADDSIIIRRHSSSSYSSTCLSPRRLSDIDVAAATTLTTSTAGVQSGSTGPSHLADKANGDKFSDIFMSDSTDSNNTNILNKDDCLSLKEKLNSKLSRALKVKRKRDGKTDKLETKQKKLKRKAGASVKTKPELNKLSLSIENRVAEITVLKQEDVESSNLLYTVETLNELRSALEYVDSRQEVNVTLLVSAAGSLCGGLDLSSLQQLKGDPKVNAANEIADAVRALLECLEQHSKLVCAGVDGACVGVGLALLALCDVVVASDRATFSLLAAGGGIAPGAAVLTSHRKSLCRSLITEMLVFGRQLSAAEALSRGLVSRTLWPDRFSSELRAMVQDMAGQPPSVLQLKKKLLGLRNNEEARSSFVACLDAERDLLAEYWSSDAGQ